MSNPNEFKLLSNFNTEDTYQQRLWLQIPAYELLREGNQGSPHVLKVWIELLQNLLVGE